ncbi:hypothetical protein KFL_000640030 [Klebsormidium nitens]|uniref:Uncharacterized protein n=1 Tax=Klebsormidium nitens TaxID=105231 RepID=A0A1Y1HWD6_KLENI|nr:hypothetical protein KFL_000640030 [Klebsormidium nitens]|eukprot:GAQ80837.1 hypothetical protein KFL_000640030 [Klebsormidium nitens]
MARSALGFTSEPRVEVERAAGNLLKDAASVLVYQSVLTGAPAQALLKLLLALRRSDDQVRILESYGQFFQSLAKGGHASWEEYVLDRILAGEDNPFATAAAKGQAVSQTLLAAAAADLDVLQGLAIMEHSLVSWVGDVVSLRPEWKFATAGTTKTAKMDPRPPPESRLRLGFDYGAEPDREKKLEREGKVENEGRGPGFEEFGFGGASESHSTERKQERGFGGFGFGTGQEDEGVKSFGFGGGPESSKRDRNGSEDRNGKDNTGGIIGLVPGGGENPARDSVATNAEWRAKISGLWKWSEAVPLLESYYRKFGTGAVAANLSLKWQGGKLVSCAPPKEIGTVLSIQRDAFEAMTSNLELHAEGQPAHHTLLYGRSGLGKSWVLTHAAAVAAKRSGLRTVKVSRQEAKTLDKLLDEVRLHPNVRFAVLLDDLTFKAGDEAGAAFKQLLEGSFEEWPSNAIICASSPTRELSRGPPSEPAYREGGAIGQHFGLALELPEFSQETCRAALNELAGRQRVDDIEFESLPAKPSILSLIHLLRTESKL